MATKPPTSNILGLSQSMNGKSLLGVLTTGLTLDRQVGLITKLNDGLWWKYL